MSSLPFKYKSMGNSEYGIYVELYLPKRAKFQGRLYQALTEGFKHEIVREYFLNHTKRPKIIELLKQHQYSKWLNYTPDYIETLDSLYWGYSMYEVDGVFKPAIGDKVDEERTQVIRLMFLPQSLDEKMAKFEVEFGTDEYWHLLELIGGFLRSPKRNQTFPPDLKNEKERQLIQYILDWCLAVGFFLIGYVVFEICSEIEELSDREDADYEKEVWMTSFWHFNVNRIVFNNRSKNTE